MPLLFLATADLLYARLQMAFTLGFHIVFACLGVGLPVLMLFAEARFLRTREEEWRLLARRWSKAFAVLFAVGAVSGTVLSFELGLLWPRFMGTFGSVIGLPFTLEAFAFFLEAIFAGIYLYGWDRLSPRAHWWTGVPVAVSGLLSAWFVVTANAWMNAPAGFRMEGEKIVEVDPAAAMFNPATWAQTTHMILAAYMVAGFVVAGYYAFRRLRGAEDSYHRRAMLAALALGSVCAFPQMLVGHAAAQMVARTQPVKFAAMEGQFKTERRAPLRIGGIPDRETRETRFAIEIPAGMSVLAHDDPDAEVRGLNDFPADTLPPVLVVHLAFQIMVGIGAALLALSLWSIAVFVLRRRRPVGRLFLRAVAFSGPLAVLALWAGWTVTEVGRQPWIVQGVMRTRDAVTDSPGLPWIFAGTLAIYLVLTTGMILVLRILARKPFHGS